MTTWNIVIVKRDGLIVTDRVTGAWRFAAEKVAALAGDRLYGLQETDPVFIANADGSERAQYTVGELVHEAH